MFRKRNCEIFASKFFVNVNIFDMGNATFYINWTCNGWILYCLKFTLHVRHGEIETTTSEDNFKWIAFVKFHACNFCVAHFYDGSNAQRNVLTLALVGVAHSQKHTISLIRVSENLNIFLSFVDSFFFYHILTEHFELSYQLDMLACRYVCVRMLFK